nr:GNAT family N-acetyltransferase [uncultured Aminipila sp.]
MFKEAKKEDAKVFYEMYDQLRDHVEKGCAKPNLQEYTELFTSLIEDVNYKMWKILDENERVVGVIAAAIRENLFHCKKIVYIDEIVISEESRGKGFGRKGLNFVADYYKEQGDVVKLELSTDYQNTPARGFYTHIGFDDYAALYKIKLHK